MSDEATPGSLESIVRSLRTHAPNVVAPDEAGVDYAAVALLLHEPIGRQPELLFIRRARRDGDAWSGHVAFPGGRRDLVDATIEATARRETREEIGVDLGPPIARLHDLDARAAPRSWPLVVSPFVYQLDEPPRVRLNDEVDAVVWIPLSALSSPAAATRHTFSSESRHVTLPAIRYRDHVIWGMTHRMLASFFDVFGGRLAC